MTTHPILSRRQRTSGDNHHLWNNHGNWWFHGTLHLADHTSRRVRLSLRTRSVDEARQRRDAIIRKCQPSAEQDPAPNPKP